MSNVQSISANRELATLIKMSPLAARLAVIAAFVIFWEIAGRFLADPMFLSPPSSVVASIAPVLREPGVDEAILRALYEIAISFALSVMVGLLLGIVIGIPRTVYLTMMPVVIFLFAVPQSTLLPVFTSVFGIGTASKIAFGFSHGVFPILVTVIAAVQKIKPGLVTAAVSMGASRVNVIRHVVIPSILPAFFTGLRLGMASTLIGVLLAELYISERGIGYFTRKFSVSFDPAALFALIVILSTIAVLINELLRRVEMRFSRWRQE